MALYVDFIHSSRFLVNWLASYNKHSESHKYQIAFYWIESHNRQIK